MTDNTTPAMTPLDRDRGLQRLRRLTIGATAGALLATTGISYVAAASYAGKSASSTASTTASSTTTASTTSSSTTATTSSSTVQSATTTPRTGSSGSGLVTSGGS